MTPAKAGDDDLAAIEKLGQARKRLKDEISKIIIGQSHVVDDLLTAIFSRTSRVNPPTPSATASPTLA